ncbi:MAG: hypothetical protein OJF49_001002 [Ktedonobacterales bacterium]|nr:MAG: hypothetical protein OJF49_001002 [Ktedonobacterales bacterium]
MDPESAQQPTDPGQQPASPPPVPPQPVSGSPYMLSDNTYPPPAPPNPNASFSPHMTVPPVAAGSQPPPPYPTPYPGAPAGYASPPSAPTPYPYGAAQPANQYPTFPGAPTTPQYYGSESGYSALATPTLPPSSGYMLEQPGQLGQRAARRPLWPRGGSALFVAGAATFIATCFLPWYSVTVSFGALYSGSAVEHAWGYWAGMLAMLVVAAACLLFIARALRFRGALPLSDRAHYLFFGMVALVCAALYLVHAFIGSIQNMGSVTAGPGIALYVGIGGALLMTLGALLM